jgi:hypothetical protein
VGEDGRAVALDMLIEPDVLPARRLRYFFRRGGETLVARVTSDTPPPFRMRSLWTGHLLAPRAVWRRPLSVDKCPSLMTYAAVPHGVPAMQWGAAVAASVALGAAA